ncbi:hypothetical protein CBR64_15855 [Cellulosimicrobium cellulans]|uniref:Uncharacterized protein n=1 Tax=Cellulosimicrobium cellulans TaxID=1710 RepID=A0A1Y0HXD5_CELCE|nr:hypothetical protein [Cellulosimicrobium cellulans]ARU52699.1 hypothetical protein CBR64_15855 [Cellulosimicrobium cellulans]
MRDERSDGPVPRYRVLRDGQVVLVVRGEPGVLVSVSVPPPLPGTAPVTHPFATATFTAARHEGTLGSLLREAPDLAEFLAAVERAGFTVEPDA